MPAGTSTAAVRGPALAKRIHPSEPPAVDERRRREINMVLLRYRAMAAEDPPRGLLGVLGELAEENPTDPARQLDYIARLSEICTLPEGPVESVRRNLQGGT